MASNLSDLSTSFESLAGTMSSVMYMLAGIIFIIGIVRLKQYADEPNNNGIGTALVPIFMSIFLAFNSVIFDVTDIETTSLTATSPVNGSESVQASSSNTVVTSSQSKIEKKTDDSYSYTTPLLIAMSVIGIMLFLCLIVYVSYLLFWKLRINKLSKFVNRIASVPNDIVSLTPEIEVIEKNIKILSKLVKDVEDLDKKKKLMLFKEILQNKKTTFEDIIKEIKEKSPDMYMLKR